MTCRQLGVACDKEIRAGTFEEMAELSKRHGMEMFQKGDSEHIEAMKNMQELMSDPATMKKWMEGKRMEFKALPDEK